MSQPREPDYRRVQILRPSRYQNPETFTMTPAALRARRPYFVKNMVTAGALFGVTAGIYFYTLHALKSDEDDFEDVAIPPISADNLKQLKELHESNK